MPTISDDIRKVYASGGDGVTQDGIAETLEFNHPSMSSPIFVTNQQPGFTSFLEDGTTLAFFAPVGFEVRRPTRDAQGRQEMQIAIVNVGKELSNRLDAAIVDPQSPVEVTYRTYMISKIDSGTPSIPEETPPPLLYPVRIIVSDVVVTMSPRLLSMDRPFQREYFRTDKWPGLRR